MTDEELDRLANLIADALRHMGERLPGPVPGRGLGAAAPWVPAPVRPAPPARGGEPAPWTGAAQSLGDVAPIREPVAPRHRADARALVAAVRAAAAGKGSPQALTERTPHSHRSRRTSPLPVIVKIGVSNRHIHLSARDAETLFGSGQLTPARPLLQPGQFAATESAAVVGPGGRLEHVRIVGPARGETQVELSLSDAARIGVTAPVSLSGVLEGSAGGVALEGSRGRLELARGVIVPARHLHLSLADADRWGFADGDRVGVSCGEGARRVTFDNVLVRCGAQHTTELHLDVDEARAAGVVSGDSARIVAWQATAGRVRRPLVTERDVQRLAARGEALPPNALLTPSARDRARALGLLRP